jgi:dynein heavy chain
MVVTLCRLLERLLTEQSVPANAEASLYELYFVFAVLWAFGGAWDDQGRGFRAEFSQMWQSEWRNVTFPQRGTVFDSYVRPDKKAFLPWTEVSPPFQYVKGRNAGTALVFVPETTRINFFARNLLEGGHPEFMYHAMDFNYYTTSLHLQVFLEAAIEMKSGKLYAPLAQRTCIYCIDDINMPEIDFIGSESVKRVDISIDYWYGFK